MKLFKKIFIIILLLITFIADFISIKLVFFPDVQIEKIKDSSIRVGTKYNFNKVKVYSNGHILKKKNYDIKVDTDIDLNKVGDYTVKYIVTYGNKDYMFKYIYFVIDDIKPEITLDKEVVSYSNCKNNYTDDLSFKAIDNYDGDISESVTIEKGEDFYNLTVKDSSGNETTTKINAINLDKTNFKVKLNGSSNEYVELNKEYKDQGAYATDNCGEKTDKEIVVEGSVNTSKVGTYKLTYKIKDTNFTATRTVNVFKKNTQQVNTSSGTKVVYLTFDDGPGVYTGRILDILKKYDVKATFFVTNQFKGYTNLITREAEEGHKIAVHSATHNWNIYTSVDAYMNDFNTMNDIIESKTGSRTNIFRFPGGSSNTISKGKSKGIMTALASKMTSEGYYYFDWNVDSGDAAGASTSKIISNVKKGISDRNYSVVLMHDIKKSTLNALEEIIQYGINNGYTFETLNESSPTVHHHIVN